MADQDLAGLPLAFRGDCGHWLPHGTPAVAQRHATPGGRVPVFLCPSCARDFGALLAQASNDQGETR